MKFVRYSLYLLSVLLPLSLLFNSKAIFYPPTDWNNNLYIIGYLGASFSDHFSFPAVINASNAVGAAIPMFYGYLMYPFLGMISAFVGADLALRVGCFIMLSFQFYGLISGAKAVLKHSNLAFAIAITVTWGTYSLTNLYNRASITEYFATGFMMATISFVFAAAEQQKISGKLYFIWMAAVAAIFSLGIHPPTTFVEGLYFSALGLILIAVWVSKRPVIQLPYFIYSTIVSSLTFLMVSPWLYATLKIGPKLVQWAHPGVIIFYPDRSDTFIKRFSPLPFDWLSTQQGSVNVSTPYLEAPIDFGLLIIVLFLFWLVIKAKNNRSYSRILLIRSAPLIVVFSVLWCVFISTISLSRPFASHFLSLNTYIQFAYRLVSHINAAFLVTLFSLALINKNKGLLQARRHTLDIIASICITLAALSLYIKLPHAFIIRTEQNTPEYTLNGDRSTLAMKGITGLAGMYATKDIKIIEQNNLNKSTAIEFPVGNKTTNFGEVSDVKIHLDKPNWVITNVISFPYSRIWANDKRLSGENLSRSGAYLTIHLPAGDTNLHWQWHEDPVWEVLHILGQVAYFSVITITLILFVIAGFTKRISFIS